MLLALFSAPAQAKYSGGAGTPENPYKIADHNDLYALADDTNDYNKCFVITADIDLDPNLPGRRQLTNALIAPDLNATDYGFQGTAFTGTFDGNDCNIINLTIDTNDLNNDYLGLFGQTNKNAVISNLGVRDVNITGVTGSYYVGGLVGYNFKGSVTNCYATGAISGNRYVGGLVGSNYYYSSVTNCYATGEVTGVDDVGGLVGGNDHGSVTNCYATGAVTGIDDVGGLVGRNYYYSSVTDCYANGAVTGTGDYVGGGLVGSNSGTVTASFWDIESSGQPGSSRGGKGLTTDQMKTMSIFQNAGWADKGWVMQDGQDYPRLAWESTGGTPIPPAAPIPLLGAGNGTDPYQVWTAEDLALLSWYVSVLDKHILLMENLDLGGVMLYPVGDLGPFTGDFDGNGHVIRNAVISFPGCDNVALFGYLGQSGQILNLGVEDVNVTGNEYVGGLMGANGSYPYEGGSITNCYATGAVTGVRGVGGLVGSNFDGTVTNCYATGAVTGDDYVGGLVGDNNYGGVTNCYATGVVTGGSVVGGLVGSNYYYSSVTSCYATGAVSGDWYVGGLVGSNPGSVTSCYATGAVTGGRYFVGGLVGFNSGSVTSCYATGVVTGDSRVGGLVGCNSDTVTNCYSTGAVSGDWDVGGLVGENDHGSVTNCYATGRVTPKGGFIGGLVGYSTGGSCPASFWDIETTNQETSACGEGKTTAEMQTEVTFTDAGWDFNDIWDICEDLRYPKLAWQIPLADMVCPDGVTFIDYSYFADHWLWADYGDVNGLELSGNGKIENADFALLADWWGQTACGDCGGADYSGDNAVDSADLEILFAEWLGSDYGDCEGAELTGDGFVGIDDALAFSDQWLTGF